VNGPKEREENKMASSTSPAADLLGSMVFGITSTHQAVGADTPDLSMDEIREDGPNAVSAKLYLPPGDAYLIRVEWLKDESP